MYIILKTEDPLNTKILYKGQKAHYFYADNLTQAQTFLKEVEDTENTEYWSKYNANSDLVCCKEFYEYLKQIILEPNKLTRKEMQELCLEAQKWFSDNTIDHIDFYIGHERSTFYYSNKYYSFQKIWEELVNIIDRYTQTKNNISPWEITDNDFHPVKDFGFKFHFGRISETYQQSLCGVFNMKFYKLIYYFDFLGIKIDNPRLRDFWEFYKKTLNVYSISIRDDKSRESIDIIPKPDEIYIKDEILHYSYNTDYYCDGIKVEKWFYDADRKSLKLSDFDKLKNIDFRSIFIKKIGIEKFIRRGEIIDSWENYPDNEWWAKSEYKLIDMKKIMFKEITTSPSGKIIRSKNYDYAPFLYMKNQTTGEYHLEGVSPNCKDLYDALKMRYKDLNLPTYDIKDIK